MITLTGWSWPVAPILSRTLKQTFEDFQQPCEGGRNGRSSEVESGSDITPLSNDL